jgi:hypothetical protein
MGIGEKKSVLRGMYHKAPASEPQNDSTAAPAVPRVERFEARVDSLIYLGIHAAIYLLFLVGLAVFAARLSSLYSVGLTLDPGDTFGLYARGAFSNIGASLFLILLGAALFALFKNRLPRRARWVALGFVLSLFPLAIASIFFFSTALAAGRDAGFARLNAAQLFADAQAFAALAPLDDNRPVEIDGGHPLFGSIPTYTSEHLHPDRIRVFPHGILIILEPAQSDVEGLIIPTEPRLPPDPIPFARRQSLKLLSTSPPVFRFQSAPDTKWLEASSHPSTLPALAPGFR